jgi:hypothetical protein
MGPMGRMRQMGVWDGSSAEPKANYASKLPLSVPSQLSVFVRGSVPYSHLSHPSHRSHSPSHPHIGGDGGGGTDIKRYNGLLLGIDNEFVPSHGAPWQAHFKGASTNTPPLL